MMQEENDMTQEIRQLVMFETRGEIDKIINKQMEDGQFMNADITFKELQTIKKVLKKKLKNIYHLRIEYPE
jgi:membrane-associated HD superfamily phosphohydrolase